MSKAVCVALRNGNLNARGLAYPDSFIIMLDVTALDRL